MINKSMLDRDEKIVKLGKLKELIEVLEKILPDVDKVGQIYIDGFTPAIEIRYTEYSKPLVVYDALDIIDSLRIRFDYRYNNIVTTSNIELDEWYDTYDNERYFKYGIETTAQAINWELTKFRRLSKEVNRIWRDEE